MSVRPSASRTEEGARETGKGLVARTWRRSKAVGGGSLGSRGLMSGSVRKAAEKVESISAGRRGGGPPKKPMAFCASRESSASLSGSPPVPALVCSLSPVRIWRQERGRLAASGEARLATLLAFVYDREPYFSNKVRDGRVGGA